MSVLDAVRRANRPGPAEDSIVFRIGATAAVAVAVVACWSQGELSLPVTAGAVGALAVGNVFSYHARRRSLPWLKVALAVAVVGSFVWFFGTVTTHATIGDLASVEGPLAVLFTLIQVTHAFDVPSRRDLGFSMAGSATLMAVAAAQAVEGGFALYVLAWAACCLGGLVAMWGSMAGGARTSVGAVAGAAGLVVAIAAVVVAILPATHASSRVVFPSSLAGDISLPTPGALVGGGPKGTEPLRAGTPSGPTRVGGYLGFSGPLDTAVRGTLGSQVVMRVRADQPTFWLAETFDTWNGQSWLQSPPPAHQPQYHTIVGGPPFLLPVPRSDVTAQGTFDIQTFYVAVGGPNLVFHAANATEVWFPSSRLYIQPNGTILAGTTMGPGSVYTVESLVDTATPAQLRAPLAGTRLGTSLPAATRTADTALPRPYDRAAALARQVTAGIPDTYDKVLALENWMGAHTRYTTDIPPLQPGQDTVNAFLFGSRQGYCEQISTALAVMLRSLGIPAREATGYVPGPYNPVTDLYDVEARDAHAWVQVWFPGYGWQSFDPTAAVPLANPSPGSALAHDAADALGRLPLVPVGAVLAAAGLVLAVVRRRRRQPHTWAGVMTATLLDAARRAGIPARPGETLAAVAQRLEDHAAGRGPAAHGPAHPGMPGDRGDPLGRIGPAGSPRRQGAGTSLADPPAPPVPRRWAPWGEPGPVDLASAAERAAYGGGQPDLAAKAALVHQARRIRRVARSLR